MLLQVSTVLEKSNLMAMVLCSSGGSLCCRASVKGVSRKWVLCGYTNDEYFVCTFLYIFGYNTQDDIRYFNIISILINLI